MIDELTAQRRGMVLETLRRSAGMPTTGAMLSAAVAAFYLGEERELVADLDYLVRARLIEREERKLRGVVTRLYTLTADGYRVADGAVTDPGVAPPTSIPGV